MLKEGSLAKSIELLQELNADLGRGQLPKEEEVVPRQGVGDTRGCKDTTQLLLGVLAAKKLQKRRQQEREGELGRWKTGSSSGCLF